MESKDLRLTLSLRASSEHSTAIDSTSHHRFVQDWMLREKQKSDQEDGINGRKKLRLSKLQSSTLENTFKLHHTLNPKEKMALAKDLKLRPRQVEVWFQNRRARKKLKKTEVDCEMLKRYCENLSEENRRLQKELMDLKAPNRNTNVKPINLPMQITTCPSCQRRINNDGDFDSFHRQRISNLYRLPTVDGTNDYCPT